MVSQLLSMHGLGSMAEAEAAYRQAIALYGPGTDHSSVLLWQELQNPGRALAEHEAIKSGDWQEALEQQNAYNAANWRGPDMPSYYEQSGEAMDVVVPTNAGPLFPGEVGVTTSLGGVFSGYSSLYQGYTPPAASPAGSQEETGPGLIKGLLQKAGGFIDKLTPWEGINPFDDLSSTVGGAIAGFAGGALTTYLIMQSLNKPERRRRRGRGRRY